MSYIAHDHLPGTWDALFKLIYDAQHLAHILVADDETGGHCNFAEARDSRGVQFLRRGKLRGPHVSEVVQIHLIDSLANTRVYLLRRAFGANDPYSARQFRCALIIATFDGLLDFLTDGLIFYLKVCHGVATY